MPLPGNWTSVTVTGEFQLYGDALKGAVTFTASDWVTDPGAKVIQPAGGKRLTLDADGRFSVPLPVVDDADISPTGWTYRVDLDLTLPTGLRASRSFDIQLTAAMAPTVDLADVVPVSDVAVVSQYLRRVDLGTVVETPAGAQAKVAAHVAATDPHGDRAYTDTGLAGRVPTSRAVTAGTGLTGGGALTADRSLAVAYGTTAGTAAQGNDSRLSNARTPTAHASSHAPGGSDALAVDAAAGTGSLRTLGTGAQQAAVGADAIRRQLVDAKGDLLVGTADDTVTRLAVGADGTFRLSPDPAAAGGLAWWRGDGLATGASTHARREIAGAITLVSATVRFMYFTAPRNETWTQVTSVTGGTAAGATPTLCRMGVYSVDGFGDLTLVAACANDTTLWGSTNTLYTRSFTASYNAIAGQRYAAAILIVTAATLPAIVGGANLPIATTLSRAPQLSGRITGQTDLPGSVSAGSLLTLQEQHYLEVLP